VAPTVLITGAPTTSTEGTAISLGSSVSDVQADIDAGFTYSWSVTKNGSSYTSGTADSLTFTPNDNGIYVVSLTATDKDAGASTPATKAINVTNVAPTVDTVTLAANGGVSCLAGNTAEIRFTFHDPGTVDATWVADIDWGDGSPHGSANLSGQGGTFGPFTHTYAAGSYTPVVRVTDKDAGAGSKSATTGGVSFLYTTSGILQPINLTGTRSSFKIGSTIPVKLRVTDCAGMPVSGLVLKVALAKLDSSGTPVNEVIVDSVPDVGNTMRFSGAPDSQYIYNLSTKRSQLSTPVGSDLTSGSYRVTVSGSTIASTTADFDTK
jgi:hypothetical protein